MVRWSPVSFSFLLFLLLQLFMSIRFLLDLTTASDLFAWSETLCLHVVLASVFIIIDLFVVCLFAFCAPLRNIVMSTAFIKALLLSLFLPLIFSGKSPCYRAVLLFSRVVSFSFFSLFILSVWIDYNLLAALFFYLLMKCSFFFFNETRERRMLRQLRLRVLRQASFSFPFIHVLLMLFFFIVCLRSSLYLFSSTFSFSMSTAFTRRK